MVEHSWKRVDRFFSPFHFLVGDLERELHLPVICMMDRLDKNSSVGKSQMGYINFVVKPLLTLWYNPIPKPV